MRAEHDFLILGGGSAGCLLARRLWEAGKNQVALVENGQAGWLDPRIKIPAAFVHLYKTRRDYAYFSVPQPNLKNRRLFLPRGRVLGGSGSINAMIYIRGHRAVYDHWASLGNSGWDYDSVLPYFKRTEKNQRFGEPWHGTQGLLNIADLLRPHPLSRLFVEAMAEAGIPPREDLNEPETEGAGLHQVNQRQGERHSPARAFIRELVGRPGIVLLTGHRALRLVLNETGTEVSGVEVLVGKKKQTLRARKGYIVSCGAFDTPALLLRSGIGDAEALNAVGIQPIVHLPAVGKNLQDHPYLPLTMGVKNYTTYDQAETLWNILSWYVSRSRSLMTTNAAEAGGFWRSSPGLPQPDIQFHFVPAHFMDHGFVRSRSSGISLCAILIQPQSRGSVTLNPHDVWGAPLIDPAVFSDSEDLATFQKGVLKCSEVLHGPIFQALASGQDPLPNRFHDETSLQEHIRNYTELLYHPAGTCRMGTDPSHSVTSPSLQVHGISNLFVADASVMPTISAGNTHAPTLMIAEKASELIQKSFS
ncbi:MAG: GMC family oxidoreductase N-terminal domain-containing protein [Flavobacteriales bacterium]|nr:GMC family oxidoreductase N-terminal domain-containing protein [Flavobacteriales bacterium]